MKKLITSFCLTVLICFSSFSQHKVPDYKVNLGFGLGAEKKFRYMELSMSKDLFNLFEKKLRIGLGMRMNWNSLLDGQFTTSTYQLEDKSVSFIDSFSFKQAYFFSTNLFANVEYYVFNKWSVGLNTDVIGYGFGANRKGDYSPQAESTLYGSKSQSDVSFNVAKASVFSFLQSKGNITSQLFIRFDPTRKISLKVGYNVSTLQLTTKTNRFGKDQFNKFGNFYGCFFGGISMHFYDDEKEKK